jgi:hypothetical protein
MQIFISYRFTGENIENLKSIIGEIKNILESKNNKIFCSLYEEDFFRENNFSVDAIYQYCNDKLVECDLVYFFIKSNESSKGMKLEFEEAKKYNKKIILLIQKDFSFFEFRESANEIIEYDDFDHLYELLNNNF